MSAKYLVVLVAAAACWLLAGCQPSYSAEMSIPLSAADRQTLPIQPLDVQAAVEKIAAAAGLVPYTARAEEEDLLSIADSEQLNPAAPADSARLWKHPEQPVFLSLTRHPGEFVVLANYARAGKTDPKAVKVYKALEKQLSALPASLTAGLKL
ncbi:MAG TPA: hypothetical protein PK052_05345 [Anaerohalosphaeraceae bacterium]|nr:hypothetical protein [Phycisphaerae bacterium]HOK94771.1 hypothetical protein [Anaerohalosphaeraceae bacterium]HOL31389.1 hypothetical protein [Anaerohalosphaeraceae bacterium]HOM76605.1 hypothetical protein [Anaerohalosphaeraceae bacterium]HPC64030.1 hypothetical protein [Anaerohalosphaeraceae bacterium]